MWMPTSFDLVEVVNGEGDLVDVRVTTGAANPLVLACIALGGVVDPDHRGWIVLLFRWLFGLPRT